MPGIDYTQNFDALVSTTWANMRPGLMDAIFYGHPFFHWLFGPMGRLGQGKAGKKKYYDGGNYIGVNLQYGKNGTFKSMAGYETIDTTPTDGITQAQYPWREFAGSVSISKKEENINRGKAQIINLLQSKQDEATQSALETLSAMLFSDGTGNGGKDFLGLQALIAATGTLAGIDRATYTWFKSNIVDLTNAVAVPVTMTGRNYSRTVGSPVFKDSGITVMRSMFNMLTIGQQKPDLLLTDQATYENFEDSFEDKVRLGYQKMLDAGFENVTYKGATTMWDSDCTAGSMYFLNSDTLEFAVNPGGDFEVAPFVTPANQKAKVSTIYLMGNIVCSNPRLNGRVKGLV